MHAKQAKSHYASTAEFSDCIIEANILANQFLQKRNFDMSY